MFKMRWLLAMGLGLVRTEFVYMNREDLPSEDEQYEFFAGLVAGMEGRPVTLRTLDVGGDKLPEALAHYAAADSANPALGLRAIRLSLKERRLLDAQLAAMLRAAAHLNVHLDLFVFVRRGGRHGGPGVAPDPSLAHCRRSRDGGPDQPGPFRVRHRTQW